VRADFSIFSLTYDFHAGNGNNGNVWAITNNRDSSRNQTFSYDQLNRLMSAQNAGTDCTKTTVNGKTEYWGNSYGYDPWGNLITKTPTKCSAENLNEAAWTNNQLHTISGADNTYDAAGNMTHDATTGNNYNYDAENRITGAAGYTYIYDADGNRVEKSNGSTGTIYWYMSPGIVAESDLGGNPKSEYVFFAGGRVARKDFPGNTVSYYFSDHLKTASVNTDSAGNIKEDEDYYPWGGELQLVNNDSNHYKFTSKERDSESGLDWFSPGRHYSSALGRFVSTDPLNIPKLQLDQKRFKHFISNPQNWNAYSYSLNDPASKIDPDGFLTIIVPGTWNDHNEWDNSKFKEQVEKTFAEKAVTLNNNDMGNNDKARHSAAEQLRTIIANHKFAPGEKLNIVAHSHGGNVVGFATQEGTAHKIDVLVTLGTPVRDDYKPNESQIGLYLNVYSEHDDVQKWGGSNSRTMWAPAKNLDATAYANGHSELWQKPQTWDKVVVPELKK
jgi:RHS repeat-associated protein